jgi:hypothetical protein
MRKHESGGVLKNGIFKNKGITMAKEVKQKHGGTLKVLQKGETANPNGRPRKYVSLLKEQGYKLAEINDSIQALMSMTPKELEAVTKNPDATVLELTVAKAMVKSMNNGSLYSMDTLLSRVYGKPKEQVDVQQDTKIEVVFVDGKTIL